MKKAKLRGKLHYTININIEEVIRKHHDLLLDNINEFAKSALDTLIWSFNHDTTLVNGVETVNPPM